MIGWVFEGEKKGKPVNCADFWDPEEGMRTVLMLGNDIIEREALASSEEDQTQIFVQHHLRWLSESTKRGTNEGLARA